MSQESHQTLSLCVPVNSLRPMSFATSACTVSFVGVCALIAVFTIGTSIRWLGMLSETKTVGTSAAYQGISGPIGIDHLIRSAPCWAKSDTFAKINAASYLSVYPSVSCGDERLHIRLLPFGGELLHRLVDAHLETGRGQLLDGDPLEFRCHPSEVGRAF